MASSYPGGIDAFVNPDPADALDSVSVPHAGQHGNVNDAIEAIETELGTDPAGGSATVAARFGVIEANDWVTAARIADGAVDTARLADDAVTVAKITPGSVGTVLGTAVDGDAVGWRFPGPVNLLGSAQASIPTDTTGWVAYNTNTTLSFEGGDGKTAAGCLKLTANTTAATVPAILNDRFGTPGIDGAVAVEEGATYTCTAWVKESVGTRGAKIGYLGTATASATTATDSLRYDTTGQVAAGGLSGWTLVSGTFTVTPGSGTNYARFGVFGVSTGSIGDVLLVDDICVYRSPSVSRQIEPGGDPVGNPYAGVLWSETVGRRGFLWDNYNSRWQMVYGDTGIRDISLETSYTPSAYAVYSTTTSNADQYLRRVGHTVSFSILLTMDAANYNSGTSCFNFPTGFRPWNGSTRHMLSGVRIDDWTTVYPALNSASIYLRGLVSGSAEVLISGTFTTTDTWPTALPGTNFVSPPSA